MRRVPEYPNYLTSEDGKIICGHHRVFPVIIKQHERRGYLTVTIALAKNVKKSINAHRLVMMAWNGPPPNNEQICVHHIDHNKENNHASNLKWVSYSENIKYNYDTGGQIGKAGLEGKFGRDNPGSKLIRQYHPEDGLVRVFWGAAEAARETKSNAGHISAVCHGDLRKHNGFIWRYVF